MNGLDLLLVVGAALAAYGGWRLGFVRRLSGWIGAGIGLALGIVIAPDVVDRLRLSSDTAIVLSSTALMVLLATIGQGIGAAIGARLHHQVDTKAVRQVDAVGGSLLGIVAIAVLAWLVVPVMGQAAGWPAAAARGSALARFVDERLPDPPPQIADLERQLVDGGYPQLFTGLRRAPEIPPPPTDSPVPAEVFDRSAPSTVRIQGEACGRIQSGSGFVVAPGVVVTNAHVVAGTTRSDLDTPDGAVGRGEVIAFDPSVDLALLRTDLDRRVLPLADPAPGDLGLVMGFPGGGSFSPSPFEVGGLIDARGYDIYDREVVERELLTLASALEPGDSGSAVLRADGSVIGLAVAVAPDRPQVAYGLNSSELSRLLARGADGPVDTGPCTR